MATIDDDDDGGGEIKEGSSEEEGEMLSISSILPSAAQTYEPALEPLSEAVSCRSVCLPNSANRRHTAHTHTRSGERRRKNMAPGNLAHRQLTNDTILSFHSSRRTNEKEGTGGKETLKPPSDRRQSANEGDKLD